MLFAEQRRPYGEEAGGRSEEIEDGRKRSTSKRELIDTGTDKRYVKRTAKGRFKESDDVSRSLSADRRKTAKKKSKTGFGDQGDRNRAVKKASD